MVIVENDVIFLIVKNVIGNLSLVLCENSLCCSNHE